MREYGQIQCSFWTDPDTQGLSDTAKALACYLLTGPHSNGLGSYRLPDGYIQADFGWAPQTVSKGFRELFEIGFCERCEDTQFVLIPKYLRWNPISNENVGKAREREFGSVPKKARIYNNLVNALLEHGRNLSEGFRNHLETLSKQDPIQPNPTKKGTQPNGAGARESATADRFEEFWEAYPKKVKKKDARDKWKSHRLDERADEVIADVKSRKTGDGRWLRGFAPDPTTYINGSRWEDEIEPPKANKPSGDDARNDAVAAAKEYRRARQ